MPTLTERKPPKRIPGKFRSINKCAELEPEPTPGSYDVFYGPFDSWLNVKDPPPEVLQYMTVSPAVGDGVADDSDAIQFCLDFCGFAPYGVPYYDFVDGFGPAGPGRRNTVPGHRKWAGNSTSQPLSHYAVCYLPAGTYRLTKGLKLYNRTAMVICGEHPGTTIIKYDGQHWSEVNWDDEHTVPYRIWIDTIEADAGMHAGAARRITFDGNHKARYAFNLNGTARHGGGGSSIMEYLDCKFINAYTAFKAGGVSGDNDDTASVRRCEFRNCTQAAWHPWHQNVLSWQFLDCLFEELPIGITGYTGSFNCYNCLFINIGCAVFQKSAHAMGMRGNVCIVTPDAVIDYNPTPITWAWPGNYFFAQSDYNSSVCIVLSGNLILGPVSTLYAMGGGVFIDNEVFDNSGSVGDGTATIALGQAWSQPGWSSINLTGSYLITGPNGRYVEAAPWNFFASGNTYNGGPANSWGIVNPEVVQDNITTRNAPRPLSITDQEVAQIVAASHSNHIAALLTNIKSRMPKAPARSDPTDITQVKLTEIGMDKTGTNIAQVGSQITAAITGADPDKINLIHFGPGNGAASDIHIPSGIRFMLIGDGSNLSYAWDKQFPLRPFFTIGDDFGGPVKLRMDGMNIQDDYYLQPNLGFVGFESPEVPLMQFKSGDRGRIYTDYLSCRPNSIDYNRSSSLSRGFQHLKIRHDTIYTTLLHAYGSGTKVTKPSDCGVVVLGMWVATANKEYPDTGAIASQYFVKDGAGMHLIDCYGESQGWGIDLRGGDGYLIADNTLKQAPHMFCTTVDSVTNFISDFDGDVYLLNLQTFANFFQVDPSPKGRTIIWGVMAYNLKAFTRSPHTDYFPPGSLLAYQQAGLPTQWLYDGIVEGPGMFGLTPLEAANPGPNLGISGNLFNYDFIDPPTFLVGDMPETFADTYIDWNPSWSDSAYNQRPFLWIEDEICKVANWDHNGILVNRAQEGTTPAAHASGTPIYWLGTPVYWLPRPRGLAKAVAPIPQNFTFPADAFEAWRYRPLEQPKRIDDPTLTDIVLHKSQFMTYRPWAWIVDKTGS